MLEILLPRTDAGVLLQLAATLATGVPLFVYALRRRQLELGWFVAGVLIFLLGFFAFRTVH